jgi:hypothetical protein
MNLLENICYSVYSTINPRSYTVLKIIFFFITELFIHDFETIFLKRENLFL